LPVWGSEPQFLCNPACSLGTICSSAHDSKKERDIKRKMKNESDREKSEKNNEQIKMIVLSLPNLQGSTLSNKHLQCHVLT